MATALSEFRFLEECRHEAGLGNGPLPEVRRIDVDVEAGPDPRRVSSLVWGDPPSTVLLHGGAQNAHTWDTVALALGVPLVAVDLPGHGHSGWRSDGAYSVISMADDVVRVIGHVAPAVTTIAGVGLGASVALLAADRFGGGVERVVLIDSLPGPGRKPAALPADAARAGAVASSVSRFTSQARFDSFEQMLDRAREYSPGRSEGQRLRGLIHNSVEDADGTWRWRWDPRLREQTNYATEELEAALERFAGDVLVVRAGLSDVISDATAEDAMRRKPSLRVVTVDGAEHGVQGTHPLALARLISGG
jgi:pimeloyl-ACP methyl ester carboxylesterase